DEDVAKARTQPGGSRRMLAEQLQGERDLITEVDHTVPVLDARVRVVRRGELLMRRRLVRLDIGVDRVAHRIAERFGERDVRFRSNVLIARSCEQIEERANVLERITSRAIALQGKRDFALSAAVEMLADQNDLLRRRQNAQLAAPPKLQGKL